MRKRKVSRSDESPDLGIVGGESANLGYYCFAWLDVLNNRPSTLAQHHTLFQISSRAADIIYHSCHKGHPGLFAQCESVCIGQNRTKQHFCAHAPPNW